MPDNDFDSMLGDLDYDPMTGQDLPKTVEKLQDLTESKIIEDGHKLQELSKHPGWVLVKKVMEETIDQEMRSLVHVRDLTALSIIQGTIKARKELLGWLEMRMHEAKTLLDEEKSLSSQP